MTCGLSSGLELSDQPLSSVTVLCGSYQRRVATINAVDVVIFDMFIRDCVFVLDRLSGSLTDCWMRGHNHDARTSLVTAYNTHSG